MTESDIIGFAPPLCLTRAEADTIVAATRAAIEAFEFPSQCVANYVVPVRVIGATAAARSSSSRVTFDRPMSGRPDDILTLCVFSAAGRPPPHVLRLCRVDL